MKSPHEKRPVTSAQNAPEWPVTTEIGLVLALGPLVLGLLGGKAVLESLEAIGQASEEVFRGDRLPVLHFPTQESTSP